MSHVPVYDLRIHGHDLVQLTTSDRDERVPSPDKFTCRSCGMKSKSWNIVKYVLPSCKAQRERQAQRAAAANHSTSASVKPPTAFA